MSDPRGPEPGRFEAIPVYAAVLGFSYLVIAGIFGLPAPPGDAIIIFGPALYGLAYWVAGGASLLASAAWTALLASWMAFSLLVIPRPIGLVGLLIGVAAVYVMTTSATAIAAWSRVFDRNP